MNQAIIQLLTECSEGPNWLEEDFSLFPSPQALLLQRALILDQQEKYISKEQERSAKRRCTEWVKQVQQSLQSQYEYSQEDNIFYLIY